ERRIDDLRTGVDVRLSDKLGAQGSVHRGHTEYAPNSVYFDANLARLLNYKTDGEAAAISYALTPYTTVAVTGQWERDRFDESPVRDSDNVVVTPSVEFKPAALISGRASFGFHHRKYLGGEFPDFNGTTASADLTYILLERTRLTFNARRDLQYSYYAVLQDYVNQEFNVSVVQRLGESWDAGGSVGYARLLYSQNALPLQPAA